MDGFLLVYAGFDPEAEGLREALTSTGNGYLCARGAAEWEDADGVHYPGTYLHGGYNRETTMLGGLPVLNEDLVNLPNWLVLQLRIPGGDVIQREPFGAGGGRRRRPRAERGRPDRVRALREPRHNSAFPAPAPLCARLKGRPRAEVPGSDLRRGRSARRLAARKGMARVTA